eukprot:5395436-Pleurochrysis_carterae.AAC.5
MNNSILRCRPLLEAIRPCSNSRRVLRLRSRPDARARPAFEEPLDLLERLIGRLRHAQGQVESADARTQAVDPKCCGARDRLLQREEGGGDNEVGGPVGGGCDADAG